jgi:tetratricopeptide (TPR) repeat protein
MSNADDQFQVLIDRATQLAVRADRETDLAVARGIYNNARQAVDQSVQIADNDARKSFALNCWAAVFAAEARRVAGDESGALVQQAIGKYQDSIAADATNTEPWLNWLTLIKEHASSNAVQDAATYLDSAYTTFAEAATTARAKKEMAIMLNDWGKAIIKSAKILTGRRRDQRSDLAIAKFRQAADCDPANESSFSNWQTTINEKASNRPPHAAHKIYQAVYPEFQRVTSAANQQKKLSAFLVEWGRALQQDLSASMDDRRDAVFDKVVQRYDEAVQADGQNMYAFWNWGIACREYANGKDLDDARKLLRAARAKFEAALALATSSRQKSDLQNELALALVDEAGRRQGERGRQLLYLAIDKYNEAIQTDEKNAYPQWGLAIALTVKGLSQSTLSLSSYGHARSRYEKAAEFAKNGKLKVQIWCDWAGRVEQLATIDKHGSMSFAQHAATHLRQALKDHPKSATNIYLSLGNLLREAGQFDEALTAFRSGAASDADSMLATFCQNNLASLFDDLGMYAEARKQWSKAREKYANYVSSHALTVENQSVWGYYGGILFEVFGEFDAAKKRLTESLSCWADPNAYFSVTLTRLSKEQAEQKVACRPEVFSRARAAERTIRALPLPASNREQMLGEVALAIEHFDSAAQQFQKSLDLDANSSQAHGLLGLTRLRQNNYQEARRSLQKAHRLSPNNLTIQCQLAEALAKCGEVDAAERLFAAILDRSNQHVDAHVGLAELGISLGDETRDPEGYERAVMHLSEVITLNARRETSRRLSKKELAQIYYSRGYAQIRLNTIEGRLTSSDRIPAALHDFDTAIDLDRFHAKASTARNKVRATIPPRSERAVKSWGSFLLCAVAMIVFLLAQFSFWAPADSPASLFGYNLTLRQIEGTTYAALTFGAMAFLIAGLYLPQLLKLKVGVIEFERSPMDVGGSVNVGLQRDSLTGSTRPSGGIT